MKRNIIIFTALFLLTTASCKKFIDAGAPRDQLVASSVYSSDASAISVIRGIYSQMIATSGFASGGTNSITYLAGISADELTNFSSAAQNVAFYKNNLNPSTVYSTLWSDPYKYINNANALLEGLEKPNGVSQATATELTGEAKFIRAFCYFYLTNLFGEVPLILTTDYTQNAVASKSSMDAVYQQMIADLLDAQSKLFDNYSASNNERDQPNKMAATALLARVYLYKGDWVNAAAQATMVISNPAYVLNTDLTKVFLGNSTEAIWQLKPNSSSNATNEGPMFIPVSTPSWATISNALYNSFETGDNRKTSWIGNITVGTTTYNFPNKYKVRQATSLTEYSMVLRLAEQYLIRAEAKARLNDLSGAKADVNVIRNRAGLGNTTANDQISILAAILQERRVEFFAEWGHRWFDLKRTGTIDNVMTAASTAKSATWQSYQQLYPIPQSEILNDRNLTQNNGY